MYRLHFLFLSLIVLFATSCRQKEMPDPLAAYLFSGNARDESGNNNNAIIYGAQFTKDRFGNENSACYLNGTSAYIEAMVSDMPAVEKHQTISWWYKIDQPPVYQDSMGADDMISLVDSAAGIGLQFGYRAAGYHTMGLDGWYWGGRTVLESVHPTLKEWHHCVYTYDGERHLFYLDGRQTAQSFVKPQQGRPNMLMFGNYPGGDQFFTGSLDDVLIYDRTLSPSEIERLFNKKE
jgi:Concanavalin A-like lectin/glucanases superfamily